MLFLTSSDIADTTLRVAKCSLAGLIGKPQMVMPSSSPSDSTYTDKDGIENLREYFSQFGEVYDCNVMRDGATGRSRGFGFLTFKDPKTVNTVMVKEHRLDNKIVSATQHPKPYLSAYQYAYSRTDRPKTCHSA